MTREEAIRQARLEFGADDLQVDADAKVSFLLDGSDRVWVQAWVLVTPAQDDQDYDEWDVKESPDMGNGLDGRGYDTDPRREEAS